MDEFAKLISGVLAAIIGVAIVSVLVSRNSSTSSVIGAAASGFGSILQIAVSPISGGGVAPTGAQPLQTNTGGTNTNTGGQIGQAAAGIGGLTAQLGGALNGSGGGSGSDTFSGGGVAAAGATSGFSGGTAGLQGIGGGFDLSGV